MFLRLLDEGAGASKLAVPADEGAGTATGGSEDVWAGALSTSGTSGLPVEEEFVELAASAEELAALSELTCCLLRVFIP